MNSGSKQWTLWHRVSRPSRGFTLVEMMIGLAIATAILMGILSTYILAVKGLTAVSNYAEIHAGGRRSADTIARDMRSVSSVVSFPNPSNIVVAIPTSFDLSGAVTGSKTVTYFMSNGALYRTDSSTGFTDRLATNIYQLTFTLYDRNTNVTSQLNSAKGIQVDIKLRKTVISQIQSEDYLSARWDMRNIP
jgi:prepilin-type N-terminal cleavage/methylation domain-containing protein